MSQAFEIMPNLGRQKNKRFIRKMTGINNYDKIIFVEVFLQAKFNFKFCECAQPSANS